MRRDGRSGVNHSSSATTPHASMSGWSSPRGQTAAPAFVAAFPSQVASAALRHKMSGVLAAASNAPAAPGDGVHQHPLRPHPDFVEAGVAGPGEYVLGLPSVLRAIMSTPSPDSGASTNKAAGSAAPRAGAGATATTPSRLVQVHKHWHPAPVGSRSSLSQTVFASGSEPHGPGWKGGSSRHRPQLSRHVAGHASSKSAVLPPLHFQFSARTCAPSTRVWICDMWQLFCTVVHQPRRLDAVHCVLNELYHVCCESWHVNLGALAKYGGVA